MSSPDWDCKGGCKQMIVPSDDEDYQTPANRKREHGASQPTTPTKKQKISKDISSISHQNISVSELKSHLQRELSIIKDTLLWLDRFLCEAQYANSGDVTWNEQREIAYRTAITVQKMLRVTTKGILLNGENDLLPKKK